MVYSICSLLAGWHPGRERDREMEERWREKSVCVCVAVCIYICGYLDWIRQLEVMFGNDGGRTITRELNLKLGPSSKILHGLVQQSIDIKIKHTSMNHCE